MNQHRKSKYLYTRINRNQLTELLKNFCLQLSDGHVPKNVSDVDCKRWERHSCQFALLHKHCEEWSSPKAFSTVSLPTG